MAYQQFEFLCESLSQEFDEMEIELDYPVCPSGSECPYCGESPPDTGLFNPLGTQSQDVSFGNGQWVPVKPEPWESNYWWSFPWTLKLEEKHHLKNTLGHPNVVWTIIAGETVTHLPEHCLRLMAPTLSSSILEPTRRVPQVVDFGPEYEKVLEYFTERMLGLDDYIPDEKKGLLDKLFDETGFVRKI